MVNFTSRRFGKWRVAAQGGEQNKRRTKKGGGLLPAGAVGGEGGEGSEIGTNRGRGGMSEVGEVKVQQAADSGAPGLKGGGTHHEIYNYSRRERERAKRTNPPLFDPGFKGR